MDNFPINTIHEQVKFHNPTWRCKICKFADKGETVYHNGKEDVKGEGWCLDEKGHYVATIKSLDEGFCLRFKKGRNESNKKRK